MISESLKSQIEKIPGEDGWWKKSSLDTYVAAAREMATLGMSDDRILRVLGDLYWAAANCFL